MNCKKNAKSRSDDEHRLFDPAVEKVVEIGLERLRPFENHPFKVKEDEAMARLMESIERWFDYVKKHEFKGEMYMVRYADDFVCLFQYENEAQRFYQLLIERLRKFGLEIAEDKSRILPFGRYKGTKESFDFLGFTHYNATSHWGKYCVLHRTSRKKLKMKREAVKKWLWEHMHESIADTIEALNVKLTGHYRYYGIYGNYIGLQKYYKYVRQELWKSKRRRDQTYWLTWKKYMNILKIHPMEYPRIYLKSAY